MQRSRLFNACGRSIIINIDSRCSHANGNFIAAFDACGWSIIISTDSSSAVMLTGILKTGFHFLKGSHVNGNVGMYSGFLFVEGCHTTLVTRTTFPVLCKVQGQPPPINCSMCVGLQAGHSASLWLEHKLSLCYVKCRSSSTPRCIVCVCVCVEWGYSNCVLI